MNIKKKIKFSKKLKFNILDKTEPGKFLNQYLGYESVLPEKFYKDFIKNMNNFFKNRNIEEWKEVIETNKSCNRPLYWQIIVIPPYTKFSLHAHPNIEYDYVAEGALYEIRAINNIYNIDYCKKNPLGPDISKLKKKDFIFNKTSKNTALINDVGSIHLSYTKSEQCVIFSLWTGVHANISLNPVFLDKFDPIDSKKEEF